MLDWGYILGRLVSAIGSWIDASNLRNQVYYLKDENEILKTALDDIQRMDNGGKISQYAKRTLDFIERKSS